MLETHVQSTRLYRQLIEWGRDPASITIICHHNVVFILSSRESILGGVQYLGILKVAIWLTHKEGQLAYLHAKDSLICFYSNQC